MKIKQRVLFVALFGIFVSGCIDKGAVSPAAKAEATYGVDIDSCTAKSETRLESKACECRADIKWKVAAPNACDQFETMRQKEVK